VELFGTTELQRYLGQYPEPLLRVLAAVDAEIADGFFLVGGTVRDYLLRRSGADLDLAVATKAHFWAQEIARRLGGATIVDLSTADEQTYRLVSHGVQIDLAEFRGGATAIEQDLRLRDFTVNSMAFCFREALQANNDIVLIDPLGGLEDLQCCRLRQCPGAFAADPARLLRAYRFCATLGFTLLPDTRQEIRLFAELAGKVAAERLSHELQLIFAAPHAADVLQLMGDDHLLDVLLPELARGKGVTQPEFHHEDVFTHSLTVLGCLEEVIAAPGRYFPGHEDVLGSWLTAERQVALKWAALLHDVGKPATKEVRETQEGEKVTFYRHDEVGAEICYTIGERLRWRRTDRELVSRLVAMHMHPFHLCNVQRTGLELSRRAILRLSRRAGDALVGLFVLAMADSLAGESEKKPAGLEHQLDGLLTQVMAAYEAYIKPVLTAPRLLTGNDLKDIFGLQPGPLFGVILDELASVQVEEEVTSREEAVAWVARYLSSQQAGVTEENSEGRARFSSCQRTVNGIKRA
jgi:poly(A) polymerase